MIQIWMNPSFDTETIRGLEGCHYLLHQYERSE